MLINNDSLQLFDFPQRNQFCRHYFPDEHSPCCGGLVFDVCTGNVGNVFYFKVLRCVRSCIIDANGDLLSN